MKYFLFAGSKYYPEGGWNDFIAASDSLDEMVKKISDFSSDENIEWWHLVDTARMEIVMDNKEIEERLEKEKDMIFQALKQNQY